MSDLISRKAVIEELENYCPDWKSNSVGCIVKSAINDCIKIVNNQPPAQQWIPCSERLPEVYEDTSSSEVVLVCGYDKESDYSWQAMGFYVKTEAIKRWFFAECKNTDVPIDWIDIVAWMPLPEPYKGE